MRAKRGPTKGKSEVGSDPVEAATAQTAGRAVSSSSGSSAAGVLGTGCHRILSESSPSV